MPLLGLAVATVVALAALLPAMGDQVTWAPWNGAELVRIALLAVAYSLVGVAAYRRSPHGGASGVAVLWSAALGWVGWNNAAIGYVLFAALLLLMEQPSARNDRIAAALMIGWALLDPDAIWGVLLVLISALQRWRDRPLLWLAGSVVAIIASWLRGFDPWAVLFPLTRPWIWADAQATNTFGDPVGLALFGGMLLLAGLSRFRHAQTRINLLALAVFALLTWQARRNGIWLGFVAAPAIAGLLTDVEPKLRRWALPGVAIASVALLVLAVMTGPKLLGGSALSAPLVMAVDGPVMYRPAFEQALQEQFAPADLILFGSDDPGATYTAWTRILTNCEPADELDHLGANAVVLDTKLDQAPIASLAADQRWQKVAADDIATVFVRVEGLP